MSTSDDIRTLAESGMATEDIARKLGIRYQHAYKVLRDAGVTRVASAGFLPAAPKPPANKPQLLVAELVAAGFKHVASWILSPDGKLTNRNTHRCSELRDSQLGPQDGRPAAP